MFIFSGYVSGSILGCQIFERWIFAIIDQIRLVRIFYILDSSQAFLDQLMRLIIVGRKMSTS